MNVAAWCGRCGESFRLAELVEGGQALHCPRCGEDLAPGYAAVAAGCVREVLAAAAALDAALGRLADIAEHLHVDRRRLARAVEGES